MGSKSVKKIMFLVALAGFAVLGANHNAVCAEKKQQLTALGIRLGSAGHMFATKMTDVINKNVPEVAVTIMTGSSKENPLNVQKNRAQIGFTSSEYAKNAYDGTGDFKGMESRDLRHFFFFSINLENFLVRADSKIKEIPELSNRKLCLGPKGYSLTDTALAALQVYGMTPESIKKNGGNVSFAADKDCAQMLQDNIVDAIFAHTGKSALIAQISPVEAAVGLKPLPYDRDKLEQIVKLTGHGSITEIEAGVYKAEPKPVLSVGVPFIFVIHKNVPDELVYKMTKAVFTNQKEILDAVGPFFKPFKLENALLGADIPVHPGALKFYKEAGIAK